jgi:DNA-binding XRE family transcriptional regulator
MDNPKAIGERLKGLRIGLGHEHSAAGFARLIGLTPQAWNHYETGKRRISLDEANKLVRKFGFR